MPTKYAPSVMRYDRATGKKWMEHSYAKTLSNDQLFELINSNKTKPKHKQKLRNILTSRGVKIVKRNVPAATE
tara:strand:- start:5 stop:223 length:219 start_codon:yes stop_codon:yes gene_type:complete